MLRKILRKLGMLRYLSKIKTERRVNAERDREEYLVTVNYGSEKTEPLTEKEKKEIENLWGKVVPIRSYREFEMFKKMHGFDPRFLTHNIYLPIVAHLLNDYKYTTLFDDKGLLGYIRPTCIKFPFCYVRSIENSFYDNDMRQISFETAVADCCCNDRLFLKPSHETSGGQGTELIILCEKSPEERKIYVESKLRSRTRDFVIQECISQHPVMAQFNTTSLNTFRITTLCLNGIFSVCSIVLRCGKAGSTVDNWGAGGIMTAVSPEGKVNAIGHDIHLNEYSQNGDCVFADCCIPQMPHILNLVEKAHLEDFSICKFIGWDIAIDKNGNPVIIELNSSQPGVIGEQLVPGPIFGNRTQEVIDYCQAKSVKYNDYGKRK